MRNIQTREGYEFWDKICAVQSYAFLLSHDGRRVVKTPDIGDWIDKHDAQVIVDHAQEEFNVMKTERDALQQRLTVQDQRVDELVSLLRLMKDNDGFLSHADWDRIDAAINPTAEAESHE